MSPRERNLLLLLVGMAFVAVNLLAFRIWYQPKVKQLKSALSSANREANFNEAEAEGLKFLADEQAWLVKSEPQPTTIGRIRTKIQQLAETEANRIGLNIKKKGFGAAIVDPSLNYHRARYEIEVNGKEADIFRWLDRLHAPDQFRAVTYVRLNPQRDDATRADCEAYLDQWFLPEGVEL